MSATVSAFRKNFAGLNKLIHRMHIYLKDGHQRRWVRDVHLEDGFCPCIGNGLMRKSFEVVSHSLEPAIWFKVLVLESVSVDCGRRIVSWSMGSHSDDSDKNQRTFFMEGECYDYDADIDELFLLATKIISPAGIGHEENGLSEPSEEDYEQCLLRMLHCYILPKITLLRDDLDKVVKAREQQVLSIEALDRKVIDECKTIDACELRMDDLRTQFLPSLEKFLRKGLCSKGFLDLLLKDVNKEERKLRNQIDELQDQVQAAKEVVAKKSSQTSVEQLNIARQKRNEQQSKLEALLIAREKITIAISQAEDIGGVVVAHNLLRQYLGEREKLLALKENRNRLLEQKNCALSVREMLDSATKELIEKGSTDANDANALGSRATDVLQGVWKPEWQKLGERIATLVSNEEHPIGNHFKQFCWSINMFCRELIGFGRYGSPSDYTPVCAPPGRGLSFSSPRNYEAAYGLEDFVEDNHRQQLEILQSEIFRELNTATEFLSDFFNNNDVQFKNKLRLCYEQCFYDKEHSFLACVYELAHHEHVDNLQRDVQKLKRLPIKLLNLQMKDEWWLELFEQQSCRTSVNLESRRPFSQAYLDGTLDSFDVPHGGLSGSYDMLNEFDELGKEAEELPHDVDLFRSLCIDAIRHRSQTVAAENGERPQDELNTGHPTNNNVTSGALLSSSAPAGERHLTLGEIIDHWDTANNPSEQEAETSFENPSLTRTLSKSYGEISNKPILQNGERVEGETFEDHFGPALQNMRDILKVTSPLGKLKCLTSSLRKITNAVQELRMRSGKDTFAAAVNAEDLLPLLILMMLQLDPWEVAAMWPQLKFTEDLMAPFLQSGCHGWALVEFQMAQRILHELCQELP